MAEVSEKMTRCKTLPFNYNRIVQNSNSEHDAHVSYMSERKNVFVALTNGKFTLANEGKIADTPDN